jgi:hypothetical protein
MPIEGYRADFPLGLVIGHSRLQRWHHNLSLGRPRIVQVGSTSCWLCAAGTPHRLTFSASIMAERTTVNHFIQHLFVKLCATAVLGFVQYPFAEGQAPPKTSREEGQPLARFVE